MTEHVVTRPRPNYMLVFVFLALLTAVEVGVAFAGLPKSMQVPLLVALAIAKAKIGRASCRERV